eukprot:7302293-Pyramimonas_sp.AAC.1
MGSKDRVASPMHRRCIDDASAILAVHRRHWRGRFRAPHRAASPMHRGCGAILRPHPLRPHL